MSSEKDLQKPLLLKEEPTKPQLKPVSLSALFGYSDGLDKLLMIIGSISALAAGVAMPFFMIFFSKFATIFIPGNQSKAEEEGRDIAIVFFILGGATWFLNFLGIYFWNLTGKRQTTRFKKMYYKILLDQEVAWYDSNDVNKLATEISGSMVAVETAIGQKISFLLSISVTSIFGFFYAYFKCWQLSLALTGFLPVMMIAGVLMMKSMQLKAQLSKVSYEGASGVAEQAFSAIRTVKSFVAQNFQENRFIKALSQSQKTVIRYVFYASASLGAMLLTFLSLYSFGFWYGKKIIIQNGYEAETVISTFFCFLIGGSSVGQVAPILKNIAEAKVAAAHLYHLMGRKKTLIEPENGVQIKQADQISLKDVTFRYEKINLESEMNLGQLQAQDIVEKSEGQISQGQKMSNQGIVLDNVSLDFKKGRVTALVGESGSGKSTVLQLIMRYYDPTQGNVSVNGHKMEQIDIKGLRRRIGYVGQEPVLFSMSIAQNLRLANPDLTDQQIEEVLRKANAWEFVSKCENGINTYVGSGGTQISGGQKQRIAIARAIAKNPILLILDEATSALDRKNERQIQKTLNSLSEGKITTLVVAHRLSTIKSADKIIVMGKGRLLEQGTHQELFAQEGAYYNLVKSQMAAHSGHNEHEHRDSLEQVEYQLKDQEQKQFIKDEKTEDKKLTEEPKYTEKQLNSVFSKLLKQSKGTYLYLIVGCLGALINGLIWPFFNVAFSNIMSLMARIKSDEGDSRHQVDMYCLLFLLVAVAGSFTTFLYSLCFGAAGQKLVYKLRTKLFIKLLQMDVAFYDKPENTPGGISTKLSQDAYQINNMVTGVLGVVCLNISTVATSLIFAFYYSWKLTLIVLAISPLMVITGAINMKIVKGMSQKSEKFQKAAGSLISDTVCNIRTVKSFGNDEAFMTIFANKLDEISKLASSKILKTSILQGLSRGSVMFVEGFTFWIAAIMFANGEFQGQQQGIFIVIFSIIFAAMGVGQNSQFFPDMVKAKVAGASIFQILEAKDEVQQSFEHEDLSISNSKIQGQIQFKNVEFKYPQRDAIVLKDFCMKIRKGEKIAFVGPSGSGKSTLTQILMRFYPIQSGQILVDGIEYTKYNLHSYRSQIGLVSQEPTLFLGTVRDNIIYNTTIKKEVDSKIAKYTKIAAAHDFINQWPQKFQKEVGQKGTQVSGGQKQRIALSRSLIRKPAIVMLDEATSALDADTQKVVFENLKPVLKSITSISIAHRLATIEDADRIVVMRDGAIIEEGAYQELMAKKENFYRLAQGIN